MNKFAIIALFALIGCATCAPPKEEVAVQTSSVDEPIPVEAFSKLGTSTNEDEMQYLNDDEKIFGDFCIESRDIVVGYFKTQANEISAKYFQTMFDSAQRIGMDVIRKATEEQVNAIKKIRGEEIKEIVNSKEEAVNEGEEVPEVEKPGVFGRIISATKSIIASILRNVYSSFIVELQDLKVKMGDPESFKEEVESLCSSIQFNLKQQIEKKFTDYKKQLAAGDPTQTRALSSFQLRNLGCLTSRRVQKLITGCQILNAVGGVIWQSMGL